VAEQHSPVDFIIRVFSIVPMILYMIVAVMLTIIAIFSVLDAGQLIVQMIVSRDFANGLVNVIYALLLTITIIVLFETVTVYFKTKHVEVRALLIAGLTGMVRHILVYNVGSVDPTILFGTVALLAVLIAGIVLVKPEQAG
jgi:phosphate starvation-inducible membrane PsiE